MLRIFSFRVSNMAFRELAEGMPEAVDEVFSNTSLMAVFDNFVARISGRSSGVVRYGEILRSMDRRDVSDLGSMMMEADLVETGVVFLERD
jgi:hypothetical protein